MATTGCGKSQRIYPGALKKHYQTWVIVGISDSSLSLAMVGPWHSQILTWHFNMPSDWLKKSLLFHELVPAMQTPCVFRELWAQH